VLKSNGEPTMLLTQVDNPADQSPRSPMLAYRSRMKRRPRLWSAEHEELVSDRWV
jgi:hypothetical protein